MTYRVRNIGIAVALAIAAALLTSFYVTNYKRHVQRGEDHVTVLVAKHDIPVGTAGSDAVGMTSTAQVPRRSVVPGSISSPDEIKSLVASQETFAGEQITTQRFTSLAQTGIEGQLRGNLRAFRSRVTRTSFSPERSRTTTTSTWLPQSRRTGAAATPSSAGSSC